MSRRGWVLLWQLATLLAVAAAMRTLFDAALLLMGRSGRPTWAVLLEVALTLAWAALAMHANRRRKALLMAEMPPPPEPVPGGRGP